MSRTSWRYILAAVGVLVAIGAVYTGKQIYDAAEQQHAHYRYQPARNARQIELVPSNAQPKGYEPDCQNPQGNSNADLCAQWAAVDQVAEANRLSALNVRLALLIAALTVTGTWFLIWTFIETRDTARRQLRAYVTIISVEASPKTDDGDKVLGAYFRITWKNSGQTPAVAFCANINWNLIDGELPPDFDFPDYGNVTGGMMVGPDQLSHTIDDRLFDFANFEIVCQGTKTAFLWAWADYTDAFDARRRVEMAAKIGVEKSGDAYIFHFSSIGRHNAVDDYCHRRPSPAPRY